ncbi:glycosyltransferase family 34 protein [Saccharata proteae CBS 121410]|uniref:Glycosyltransferase family 34 protein n=1 Tax=Saccharata proteae CBS 121410 TaxID=1314787 RepID=A0A9P4HYP4_9PEZI|nr:glycosyltransferase family 34 protein [Saccharata proteae CBS 121410]
MHFALPPRKTSQPPPYARRNQVSSYSGVARRDPRIWYLVVLAVIGFFIFLRSFLNSSHEYIPSGTPPTVLVTVLDEDLPSSFKEKIKQNREVYAARHGYATFFTNTTFYGLGDSPKSWAKVPSMRHAMTAFPHSTYFFYLHPTTLIANPSLSVESHIMEKSRLEELMIVGLPVVPPDSVIKTFAHLKGDDIDLVLTQDKEGLCEQSFIVRRGEWAKYFLDAWFDPLYRSYNFQKAEAHALEHIVQWHGTILAKLALIPQRTMNSYTRDTTGKNADGMYDDGDFIASFPGCDTGSQNTCEMDMAPWFSKVHSKTG